MPDSPTDVKTQSRSTPPSMPPPPPAITQGATRHPSFTPNTSEYRAAGGDGDGMPGRDAARLPSPPGHTLHPGLAASSDPGMVLAALWGGITHPCTGEGFWAARPEPWLMHVPVGGTTAPAVPCEVLGDGDVLVFCRMVTERWHRAARGPGHSCLQMEDAAGWGSPRRSELAPLGVPGTWGPACLSVCGAWWWQGSVTASHGGRDVLALPRPWHGGIRGTWWGLKVSVASLNWGSPNAQVALVAHGLVACLQGLHRGSVPVPVSPSRHMAGQGTCGAGSGRAGAEAGPPSRTGSGRSEGCSSSSEMYPRHVRTQGFCS